MKNNNLRAKSQQVEVLLTDSLTVKIFTNFPSFHFIAVKSLKETDEYLGYLLPSPISDDISPVTMSFPEEVPQRTTAVLDEIEHAATKSCLKLCAVACPIRRILARMWMFIQGDERT